MPVHPLARRNTGTAFATPTSNSASMPGFTSICAISRTMNHPFQVKCPDSYIGTARQVEGGAAPITAVAAKLARPIIERGGQVVREFRHLGARSQNDAARFRRQAGQNLCVSRAAAGGIRPHPVFEKREIEPLRTPGAEIFPRASVVSHCSPQGARKVDVAGKIKPDHGLGSGETQVKMVRVVAVHDPRVACCGFRHSLAKSPCLGLHPAGIPIDCVEMHDRNPEPLADLARQRRLARPARPENENALRYRHRLMVTVAFAVTASRLRGCEDVSRARLHIVVAKSWPNPGKSGFRKAIQNGISWRAARPSFTIILSY